MFIRLSIAARFKAVITYELDCLRDELRYESAMRDDEGYSPS
jgi:hypothetical protein